MASAPPGREGSPGLLRLELSPIRVTSIPETADFRMVNGVAISKRQDRVILSGRHVARRSPACGIFEVDLRSGLARTIVENSTCEYSLSWVRLSLSSDMKRLVAFRKPRLELIDMEQGTVQSLGEQYIAGAWSPDGKWLAVLEGGSENRTVLLDAATLAKRRVFGTSNLQWSPDSRFLLGVRSEHCAPKWASLMAIDVQSGKETPFEASRCRINLNTTGWVNSHVAQ
jgi:WD40 repeat protein